MQKYLPLNIWCSRTWHSHHEKLKQLIRHHAIHLVFQLDNFYHGDLRYQQTDVDKDEPLYKNNENKSYMIASARAHVHGTVLRILVKATLQWLCIWFGDFLWVGIRIWNENLKRLRNNNLTRYKNWNQCIKNHGAQELRVLNSAHWVHRGGTHCFIPLLVHPGTSGIARDKPGT